METESFIKLLKKIDTLNSKLILNEDKDIVNELKIIYIKRFYAFSNSLLSLVPNLEANKYSIIAVGVILRTCMSDLITFYYLFGLKNSNPNEYESIIKRFMADNLDHLHKDISKIDDINERNKCFKIMKSKWPEYFEKSENKVIKPFKKSVSEMAKEFIANESSIYKTAYGFYDYLSKFEHIGKLTFELQEFHENDTIENLKKIMVTYSLYLDSFISILNTFNVSNEMKNEMNEIIEIAVKI
ncbi:hypothetical protein CYCD_21810 [Tenuifilaceae bacterium CYCD]|nr:hypothetical protein CYCD_21810 [Tenuifilaceae bacterium CYCD]